MLHLLDLWFIPRFACARTINDKAGGVVAFDFEKAAFPLEKRILVGVGGVAGQAEGIYLRRPYITIGHPEINEINEILHVCAGTDFKNLRDGFGVQNVDLEIQVARRMLQDNWHLVEAISRELSTGKILYSDEPRIIVEIAKGDRSRESLLHAYRKHRGIYDESETPEKFKEDFPGEDWPESVDEFHSRFTPATDCDCDVKCQIPPYDPSRYGGDSHLGLK